MKDYIKKLEDDNILKSDENIVKFFAYIIEICVNRALMYKKIFIYNYKGKVNNNKNQSIASIH